MHSNLPVVFLVEIEHFRPFASRQKLTFAYVNADFLIILKQKGVITSRGVGFVVLIDFWFLVEKKRMKFYWTKSFQFIEDNFNVEFSFCEKGIDMDHFINVGL